MSEHGRIDPLGDLGLPIEISTYTRTQDNGKSLHWLESSCDAEDLEAAIVAVRTLLSDNPEAYIARIEINLMRGARLVDGVVQDSATG